MNRRLLFFAALADALLISFLPVFGKDISGSGWRLWLDEKAAWKDDTLYLPSEVDLAKLPVTVEEHYWGKLNGGPRPYAKNEAQKGDKTSMVPSAQPWDLDHPNLYQAQAGLSGLPSSDRHVDFGFRYFTAEGIGTNARLMLNGKRIVLRSAISWGFWGRNGLWPDNEMANREVDDAKQMGLNCLQFHRNIGKPEVLDIQDAKGLLRYEEPGAGKFILGTRYTKGPFETDGSFGDDPKDHGNEDLAVIKGHVNPGKIDTSGNGPDGDPVTFWEKYEQEKILEMVKRDRSHPSLIMYDIQNESSDMALENPRIYRVYRAMHALDPSRIITFYSGDHPLAESSQVVMLPYSDDITYASAAKPFAGWKDSHTCGGPCNYLDRMYKGPDDFEERQENRDHKYIGAWGEMLGAAVPDDYDQLVHSFDAAHPTGYEKDDMTQILAGYHDFLDKNGFRKAFPTDSSLFQAIGYREYYFWQRVIENSRVDNCNDALDISGWESTTIDNHSGLVDNHRFMKGDPKVLAIANQPEMLVIQPRKMIVAQGDKEIIDVSLINETNRTGAQTLKFTAKNPDGSVAFTIEKQVNATGGDVYGENLVAGLEVPASQAGMLGLEATLTPSSPGATTLDNKDEIEVIDVAGGAPLPPNIAVLEPNGEVTKTLTDTLKATPTKLADAKPETRLDAIVIATKLGGSDLYGAPPKPKTAKPTDPRPPAEITKEAFADALRRCHDDGTRLVLFPDNNQRAEAFAKALAKANVITYNGNVGNLGAPWFGNWDFVRQHWLVDGLPVDCALDWRWGTSSFNGPQWLHEDPGTHCDGMLLDAPGLETFIGYSGDHNTKVGGTGWLIPYGKGQIVLYELPQLVKSLQPGDFAISAPIAQRLLGNALRPHPSLN